MHAFGALLLILALSGFGFIRTMDLKQRPRELRMMLDAMTLLRNDIVSRTLPLPDALAHVGGTCRGSARTLFISSNARTCGFIERSSIKQLRCLLPPVITSVLGPRSNCGFLSQTAASSPRSSATETR